MKKTVKGPTPIKLKDLQVGQRVAFDCNIGTVERIDNFGSTHWVDIKIGHMRASTSQKDFIPESTMVRNAVEHFQGFFSRLRAAEKTAVILSWPNIHKYLCEKFEEFIRAGTSKERKRILNRVKTFVKKIEEYLIPLQEQGLVVDGVSVIR